MEAIEIACNIPLERWFDELHSLVEQEVFRARHTGLHHSQAPISNSADPEAQEPLPLEPIDGVTILDASED